MAGASAGVACVAVCSPVKQTVLLNTDKVTRQSWLVLSVTSCHSFDGTAGVFATELMQTPAALLCHNRPGMLPLPLVGIACLLCQQRQPLRLAADVLAIGWHAFSVTFVSSVVHLRGSVCNSLVGSDTMVQAAEQLVHAGNSKEHPSPAQAHISLQGSTSDTEGLLELLRHVCTQVAPLPCPALKFYNKP